MEELLKKILDKKQDNKILYGIILVITFILCNAFVQPHYSTDTYVLMNLGYFEYPKQYFLLDGRLISAMFCFLGGILNLEYDIYVVLLEYIAIIFMSLAIYQMYLLLVDVLKLEKSEHKIIILLATFILVLNQFTIDYLLYPESGVMCMGLYFVILAVNIAMSSKKKKYGKTFISLFVAATAYQGLINIFPLLMVFCYILKNLNNGKTFKSNVKEFFFEMIINAFIVIDIIFIQIIIVTIFNQVLETGKPIRVNSFSDISFAIKKMISVTKDIKKILAYLNRLPVYTNAVMVIGTLFFLVKLRVKLREIFYYIFIIACSLVICFCTIFGFTTGPVARTSSPIAMLLGISIIYVLAISFTKNKLKEVLYIITVIVFAVNSVAIIRNSNSHIEACILDNYIGTTLREKVKEYEEDTGIRVTKVCFMDDYISDNYHAGIKSINALTHRTVSCRWSKLAFVNVWCNRKFKEIKISDLNIYMQCAYGKESDIFREEQITFYQDMLVFIIY